MLSAATDFDENDSWQDAFLRSLELAASKSFHALLAEHRSDYQPFFHRVDLELGDGLEELPTDRRLEQVKKGERSWASGIAFQLWPLSTDFIVPAGLPANLQGLWNDEFDAPWFCG